MGLPSWAFEQEAAEGTEDDSILGIIASLIFAQSCIKRATISEAVKSGSYRQWILKHQGQAFFLQKVTERTKKILGCLRWKVAKTVKILRAKIPLAL